jgi:hypothetical protein
MNYTTENCNSDFTKRIDHNEAGCYVTSGLLLYHHLEGDNLCLHPEADNLWVQCPRRPFVFLGKILYILLF